MTVIASDGRPFEPYEVDIYLTLTTIVCDVQILTKTECLQLKK